jgi:hypothetical protein
MTYLAPDLTIALLTDEEKIEELRKRLASMTAQRDAWKAEAEHQYGLWRVATYGPGPCHPDFYPTKGALDAYARGKHPALANPYPPCPF